jgi:DDE superfamily endonuclease
MTVIWSALKSQLRGDDKVSEPYRLPTLADPGYDGAGSGIHVPVRHPADGRDLDIDSRTRNALLRSLRCLGESGFALLAGRWRTLQCITASPCKISDIARAALVLTHFECPFRGSQ